MNWLNPLNTMRVIDKFICVLVLAFILPSCSSAKSIEEQSEYNHPVLLGDPFILYYEGLYYAYGTSSDVGIEVYTSVDLKNWKKNKELALQREDSYGNHWFWAPEVYYVASKGLFYMYYSAEEHICVATSKSPRGPFIQERKETMLEDKGIDNSLFIDDDGKAYLSFVRFTNGNEIWVAELEDNLTQIKLESMKLALTMSQEWERVWPKVNEGSFILKHKGVYYMTYSANSFESKLYGVGYATANSVLGPWVKYEHNPILQTPKNLFGVGHSAMFRDKNGVLRIVFHAHHSELDIHPRGMYISEVKFVDGEIPRMEISEEIIETRVVK